MRFTINPITDEFDVVSLGSGTFDETITGNSGGAVGPDGTGNINIVGSNITGINIVGDPGTSTLTVSGIPSTSTQVGTTRYSTNTEAAGQSLATTALTPSNIPSFYSVTPLPASQGGTGLSSPAAHSLLVTNGSSAFTILGTAANGQLPIGSIGGDPVLATITPGSGISITNGPGSITIAVTAGSVTVETLTGNSGGAISPVTGNINTVGTGSITVAGAGNTLTTQLTGLTNHSILVGAGTATITKVGPTATAGQVLQSAGSSADPAFSTATYPSTTTINQLLYSSAANVVGGVSAVIDGVLISNHASGVPSWLANGTAGYVLTAQSGAPPAWAPNSSADLHTAKFIVGDLSNGANYSTIAAAITAASSGDTVFIQTGTYTENPTLKAGVNLTALGSDGLVSIQGSDIAANVTILGTISATYTGAVTITGVQLKTNGATAVSMTGSNVCTLNIFSCSVYANDATGITLNNASSALNFMYCTFRSSSTNILFAATATGGVDCEYCSGLLNSSAGASTLAAGRIVFQCCELQNLSISTSSAAGILVNSCQWTYSGTTLLTMAGTGTSEIYNCYLLSGTASSISAGAGTTVNIANCTISSSNTNAITGAGTVQYGTIDCLSSSTVNTTTQTPFVSRTGVSRSSLQPAFLAVLASTATNKTGNGAVYQLGTDALTEIFDQASNFNTNGTFTAPYTGKYQLNAQITYIGATAPTSIQMFITTTARTYSTYWNSSAAATLTANTFSISVLADMASTDTATCSIVVSGDAGNTTDIFGNAGDTFFSGYLVC